MFLGGASRATMRTVTRASNKDDDEDTDRYDDNTDDTEEDYKGNEDEDRVTDESFCPNHRAVPAVVNKTI